MLNKVDKILEDMVNITYNEIDKTSQKGYFSKDFIEACGIVVSLAYQRWGKDDK